MNKYESSGVSTKAHPAPFKHLLGAGLVALTLAWSGIGSAVLFFAVDKIFGLRPTEDGERVSFTATDLEIQIQTSADIGAGKDAAATTVAARKLVDILRALPSPPCISIRSKIQIASQRMPYVPLSMVTST